MPRQGRAAALLAVSALLASCATTSRTAVISSDNVEIEMRYEIPVRSALDSDIRDALRRMLGDPVAKGYASSEDARIKEEGGKPVLLLRIKSASIKFLPFVFDQNSQHREYLGEFNSRTELWHKGRMIEDWRFSRQRPFSARPRQHQRSQRLREVRAELAEWAVREWLRQLRWQIATRSFSARAEPARPDPANGQSEAPAVPGAPSANGGSDAPGIPDPAGKSAGGSGEAKMPDQPAVVGDDDGPELPDPPATPDAGDDGLIKPNLPARPD